VCVCVCVCVCVVCVTSCAVCVCVDPRRQYTFKAQSSYTPPPEPHVDSAPVSELVTDWVVAAQLTRRDAARNNDVAHAPLRLVLMTCGAARAGGAACPAASQYVQTASNTPLGDNSPTAFNRRCCVSARAGGRCMGVMMHAGSWAAVTGAGKRLPCHSVPWRCTAGDV
jgi:hypothetical protein